MIDFVLINGQQGVSIFFVISGFILPYSLFKRAYSLADFFPFLIKRSVRIDPPYWFSILFLFISGLVPLSMLSFNTIIEHVFYLVPFVKGANAYSSVYWTLFVEFQFYILLGLFYPMLNKFNPYIAIAGLVLVSAFCILMRFNYQSFIITYLYDFVFGYMLFSWHTKKISQNAALLIISMFSVFVMFGVSFISGFVPLVTSLFIVFFKKEYQQKTLSFAGNISFSLYLLHLPVCILLAKYVGKRVSSSLLLFPLCFAVSIFVSWVFYRLIEKPAMNLSKKMQFDSFKWIWPA